MFTLCAVAGLSLMTSVDATNKVYQLELETFKWDHLIYETFYGIPNISSDIADQVPSEVFMYAGAYNATGFLVAEHTSQPQPANNPDPINLQFGVHHFEDTDDTKITQFFLELHVKVGEKDSTHPWAYSNKFFSAKDVGCTVNASNNSISHGSVTMQHSWTMGEVKWIMKQQCGSQPAPTPPEPYNETKATQETCHLISFNSDEQCVPDGGKARLLEGNLEMRREYFGYCPDKCGEDQIIRTGTYGARKCGHDAKLPDSMGEHTFLVLPCEYGMFKIDDGAVMNSVLGVIAAVLVGMMAVMNQ